MFKNKIERQHKGHGRHHIDAEAGVQPVVAAGITRKAEGGGDRQQQRHQRRPGGHQQAVAQRGKKQRPGFARGQRQQMAIAAEVPLPREPLQRDAGEVRGGADAHQKQPQHRGEDRDRHRQRRQVTQYDVPFTLHHQHSGAADAAAKTDTGLSARRTSGSSAWRRPRRCRRAGS